MKFDIELPNEDSDRDQLFRDESNGHVWLMVDDEEEGLVKWVCLTSKNGETGDMIVETLTTRQTEEFAPFRGKITLSND